MADEAGSSAIAACRPPSRRRNNARAVAKRPVLALIDAQITTGRGLGHTNPEPTNHIASLTEMDQWQRMGRSRGGQRRAARNIDTKVLIQRCLFNMLFICTSIETSRHKEAPIITHIERERRARHAYSGGVASRPKYDKRVSYIMLKTPDTYRNSRQHTRGSRRTRRRHARARSRSKLPDDIH